MVVGEASEILALLDDGGAAASRQARDTLVSLLATRETWPARELLNYYARTNSSRVLDVLACCSVESGRGLLDALLDMLRERGRRGAGLAAVARLAPRAPPLHSPALVQQLTLAAVQDTQPAHRLNAIIGLTCLVTASPPLASSLWGDICAILTRSPPTCVAAKAHLALANRALFQTLYATHPCTVFDVLTNDYANTKESLREAWTTTMSAVVESVRLHPALVTRRESSARWSRAEPHVVLAEARLRAASAARGTASPAFAPAPAPYRTPTPPSTPPPASVAAASKLAAMPPLADRDLDIGDRASAPPTPLPEVEPEPAVEATPENTPAGVPRGAFRFPTDSTAVRALGRGDADSPADAAGGRLARVARDRAQLESRAEPVQFGAPPPAAAVRPEPRAASSGLSERASVPPPLDAADREVLELTGARLTPADVERAPSLESPRYFPPSRALFRRLPRRASERPAPPPRRATSCPPRPAARRSDANTQTVDVWPEPYEFLLSDLTKALPDADRPLIEDPSGNQLESYMTSLYSGKYSYSDASSTLEEQLALTRAALAHERWRRETHAERNRRLLGNCRRMRSLELHVRALTAKLRTEPRTERIKPKECCGAAETVATMSAMLAAEREARGAAERARLESAARAAVAIADTARAVQPPPPSSRTHSQAKVRPIVLAGRSVARERASFSESAMRAVTAVRKASAARDGETAAAKAQAQSLAFALQHAKADAAAARLSLQRAEAWSEAANAEALARLAALEEKYHCARGVMRAAAARRLLPPVIPAAVASSSASAATRAIISARALDPTPSPALSTALATRALLDDCFN